MHMEFKGISDAPVQCFVPRFLYTFLSAQTVVCQPNVLAMVENMVLQLITARLSLRLLTNAF